MTPEMQEIYNTLVNNAQYFQLDNVFYTIWRWITWAVIRALLSAVEILENTVGEVLNFSYILENPDVKKLLEMFVPAAWGILAVSSLIFIYHKMFNPRADHNTFLMNVLMGIVKLMIGTTITTQLLLTTASVARDIYLGEETPNTYGMEGSTGRDYGTSTSAYAYRLINKSGFDLFYMLSNGFTPPEGEDKLHLSKSNINYFDYAEQITGEKKEESKQDEKEEIKKLIEEHKDEYEEIKRQVGDELFKEGHRVSGPTGADTVRRQEKEAKRRLRERYQTEMNGIVNTDVVNYKIVLDKDGNPALGKIADFTWLQIPQKYYRYGLKTGQLFIYLLTTCIALVIATVKILQILFNIIATETIMPLIMFMHGGNAIGFKKALANIKNGLLAIIFTILSIRIYQIMLLYTESRNLNGPVSLVVQFGLALVVMDGPNIATELTGYDAGLRSTGQAIMGAAAGSWAASKLVGNTAKGIGKGLKSLSGLGDKVVEVGGLPKDYSKSSNDSSGLKSSGNSNEAEEKDNYAQTQLRTKQSHAPTSEPRLKENQEIPKQPISEQPKPMTKDAVNRQQNRQPLPDLPTKTSVEHDAQEPPKKPLPPKMGDREIK